MAGVEISVSELFDLWNHNLVDHDEFDHEVMIFISKRLGHEASVLIHDGDDVRAIFVFDTPSEATLFKLKHGS